MIIIIFDADDGKTAATLVEADAGSMLPHRQLYERYFRLMLR